MKGAIRCMVFVLALLLSGGRHLMFAASGRIL